VTLFLDRRLPDDKLTGVEQHIDGCPTCRRLVSELARTRSLASSLPRDGEAPYAVGDLVSRYVLLRVLGAGGMGTVYAGYDPLLDRKVAVKLLRLGDADDPERRTRLLREAQAMGRVSSRNVVAVFDVGIVRDQVYLAMELLTGGTLKTWLRERPRGWREIVRVFEAAGRGLAAAHAGGLVHRDFKPDNVLLEGDRVCVADFGLAAPISGGASAAEAFALGSAPLAHPHDRLLERPLTLTGAIVGTPAYISPEQLAGVAADARSDQFSFCVALYEALAGARPFGGDTLDELIREVRAGRIRALTRDVPAWLRAVVMRGLALDPAARHPSMDALLAQAARHRVRGRRRWFLAGASAVAAAGVAFGARYVGHAPDPCAGLAAQPVLHDAAAIRAAFATAPVTADKVLAGLEAWRARATELRATSCRAARDGVESAALADLRGECIADSARRIAALSAALARPTPELLDGAVPAVERAGDLTLCRSRRALLEPLREPEDPARRAVFESLRVGLATAEADHAAGRFREAIALATAFAAQASTAGFRALETEAWQVVVRSEAGGNQRPLAAREALQRALVAAEAAGYDQLRARLYLQLADLDAGLDRGDPVRLIAQARALVERLGIDAMRWEVLYAEGTAAVRAGDVARGLELLRGAAGAHGADAGDLDAADVLDALGTAHGIAGDFAAAERVIRESLAIRERLYGATSPALIQALETLGQIVLRAGRANDAIALGERAVAIAEANAGHGPAVLPTTTTNLALILMIVHRNAEALGLLDRALGATRAAYGADTTSYAGVLEIRAQTLTELGRLDDALGDALAAVDITRKKLGRDAPALAQALQVVGRTRYARHELGDALRAFSEALRIHQASPGSDLFQDDAWLGECYLAAHRPAEALPHLERALAARLGTQHDPAERARGESGTARALVALGRDRPRALELLRRARAVFAASEHDSAEQLGEVDAALARLRAK